MFKGERYIAIAELNDRGEHAVPVFQRKQLEKQRVTTIDMQAELPFVDMNHIGIHTSRVSRLARLGGIRKVSLRAKDGDISNHTPAMVGGNHGVGFAAKVGTAEIVLTSSSQRETRTYSF